MTLREHLVASRMWQEGEGREGRFLHLIYEWLDQKEEDENEKKIKINLRKYSMKLEKWKKGKEMKIEKGKKRKKDKQR
jgi:hypothetical protein